MREYSDKMELKRVCCNSCGRELKVIADILREGCFHVEYTWGYFSRQDGMVHSFDLCEECYEGMTKQFVIPIEEKEAKELL